MTVLFSVNTPFPTLSSVGHPTRVTLWLFPTVTVPASTTITHDLPASRYSALHYRTRTYRAQENATSAWTAWTAQPSPGTLATFPANWDISTLHILQIRLTPTLPVGVTDETGTVTLTATSDALPVGTGSVGYQFVDNQPSLVVASDPLVVEVR